MKEPFQVNFGLLVGLISGLLITSISSLLLGSLRQLHYYFLKTACFVLWTENYMKEGFRETFLFLVWN